MKTHGSLWHIIMRTGGSVGGTHRKPSTGTVRTRAMRGILVLALALGSLGAAVVALPGHGSTGRVPASSHQPADSPAASAGANSMSSYKAVPRPWMY
jgi:hypothetical protein